MADTIVTFPIDDLTKQVTVEVNISGYRGWLVRLAITKALITIACYIAGLNYLFEE